MEAMPGDAPISNLKQLALEDASRTEEVQVSTEMTPSEAHEFSPMDGAAAAIVTVAKTQFKGSPKPSIAGKEPLALNAVKAEELGPEAIALRADVEAVKVFIIDSGDVFQFPEKLSLPEDITSKPSLFQSLRRALLIEPSPLFRTPLLPVGQSPIDSLAMREFIAFPGRKVLLLAEGHGSVQAMAARQNAGEDGFHCFSEGVTGSQQLAGIEGFEEPSDAEGPILLKDLNKYFGVPDMPGIPTNREKFMTLCTNYGVPQSLATRMYQDLENAKTPNEKSKVITKYQIHERDKKFAHHVSLASTQVANSEGPAIGVGFMGAGHLVPGFDDPAEDVRSTDDRVVDCLINREGARHVGSHVLLPSSWRRGSSRDVRIWVYPEVLQSDLVAKDDVQIILNAAREYQES